MRRLCLWHPVALIKRQVSNLVQTTQQAAVAAINSNRSILERMGKARDWVGDIIKFGGPILVSEVCGINVADD